MYRVDLVSQPHLLHEIHRHETPTNLIRYAAAEVTPGQWVMGHGSNGSTNMDGLRGSSVDTCNPLTDDYFKQISRTVSTKQPLVLDL